MVDKAQTQLVFGYEDVCTVNIKDTLREAERLKVDFVSLPLFHPRSRRDSIGISCERLGPLTRSDRELESKDWISNVVGNLSTWIDCDNPDLNVRKASENALREEYAFGCHLGLQALVLPAPSVCSPNYAAIIQQLCATSTYQQVWVKIPMTLALDFRNAQGSGRSVHVTNGWECWDNLRHLTGHNPRLFVALELSEDLPYDIVDFKLWAAEPVKAVILPTRLFVENKKGYPVLPKQHQILLSILLQSKMHVIFRGRPWIMGSLSYYVQYVQHLRSRDLEVLSEGEKFTSAYKDTLQSPLQPLMDNLESQTYETFERDPVKYERYEAAMTRAFEDISAQRMSVDPSTHESVSLVVPSVGTAAATAADHNMFIPMSIPSPAIVVAVVGAGRGPLVAAALNAARLANVIIRVYAVEKNMNAVITLRNRALTEMWDNVTIVAGDMRSSSTHPSPSEQADVLVSELLGSWGDNELSPECLNGASSFLKPGGISIPSSYTSFLAPLSSSKLWMNARSSGFGSKGLDTPYVVKFHNTFNVAEAKPLFTFSHPTSCPQHLIDNTRFASTSFTVPLDCTVHGFSGTFECVLYKDVSISIVPHSHTEHMFSWFPLFIPIATPVRVHKGDELTANVWRFCDSRKVWYEWSLTSPVVLPIQNSGGTTFQMML